MRYAKIVFWVAGIWGLLVLTPLYFIFNMIGRQDPPPITHPAFYYGFAGVALAWQFAFFVIARDPARFRLMIIPSVLEKLGFGIPVIVLFTQRRISSSDLALGCVDLLFAALFLVAFGKTPA
ncbi:MAG TPA: hypothetical protein VJO53_09185 [Candidatus Acidoferrales bacterium]|nr:hypothetical protein [Candidatus Acidoferrales bacterium]